MIDLIYKHLTKLEEAVEGSEDGLFDLYLVGQEGNRKNFEQLNALKRLLYSIEIFKHRDSGMFAVIFLGHFSAAKSSTINCVLNLWEDPEKKRPIGNTSTDKDVTILSHPKNGIRSRLTTKHQGVSVIVRPIENPLLEEAIYLDTPGSGDFSKDEENLKEYLFWSDLVVFCSNSGETFGNNDIEVLTTKQKHLPTLPLVFAFTKVDDLFTDIIRSEGPRKGCHGFREDKYQTKVDDALEKLNERIPGHKYTKEDFFPLLTFPEIQFGIEKLVEVIEKHRSQQDPRIVNQVLEDRLAAFILRAQECKRHFLDFGIKQIKTLQDHFNQLDSNRKRFNRLATFQNSIISSELEKGCTRIKEAHRSLLKDFELFNQVSPKEFSFFEQENQEWFQEHCQTELSIIKERLKREVVQYYSQKNKHHEKRDVSSFLEVIETVLIDKCKNKKIYSLSSKIKKLFQFQKDMKSHFTKIKKKERQYLPIVLQETNTVIARKFLEQAEDFQKNLDDFTEAAATMGNLDVFKNSAMHDELRRMIEKVKTTDREIPDVSSQLIDIETIAKTSDNIFSKNRIILEEKIAQIKHVAIPPEDLLIDPNILILKSDGLPEGYNSASVSNSFQKEHQAAKEIKTRNTLSLMSTTKLKRFSKLAGFVLPPITFSLAIVFGFEGWLMELSTKNGLLDSILATFLVNGAGLIAGFSFCVAWGAFFYFSQAVKKLIDIDREEKHRDFLQRIEQNVIDPMMDQIESYQLEKLIGSINQQYGEKIRLYNEALETLKSISKNTNTDLSNFIDQLNNIMNQVLLKLSTESWNSFLLALAEQAKDKRVEELYGYMNQLVKRAEERVNAVKGLEL